MNTRASTPVTVCILTAPVYHYYMERAQRTTAPADRKTTNQGMNWIRQEKRLAIYLRDGLACAWCGDTIENGARLTLDHLTPYSKGGSNQPANLVTSCSRCNSSRGTRSVKAFAVAVAAYLNHGTKAAAIFAHVTLTS